ncbi:MAG: bifunctional UDP-N-acetylglucosamine diphosphorylase/glucosamine-1-phosphate N-acetyltransferase GlmU [Magnetococcales bacterium]|nr:bifunctional UDP-N-acetylglucosamine diphosphorylase/glucosamine-1-phosphate N-acetyltransferase GlmU [Magnetococcales bacterium]
MSELSILILAAGKGVRMRSRLPKVLHPLAGMPLLWHVLQAARALNPARLLVVIGHEAEMVRAALDAPDIAWVHQTEQLGTGHAVASALPLLAGAEGSLLILNGDVPLLRPSTLTGLAEEHHARKRAVTLLSTEADLPSGYGRIVRNPAGRLLAIVEEKDADAETRLITEINAGTYCVELAYLAPWLARLSRNNAQGEYYLTDIVALARAENLEIGAMKHADFQELAGVNSRVQLAELERVFRDRKVRRMMESGVGFTDPASCWVAADAIIGQDTRIEPHVVLGPGVVIGSGCRIGPFGEITASRIGDGCVVHAFSHLEGAELQSGNAVGPFARLRPGTVLEPRARVGNFCETKKTRIGVGSKVNHLTYLGDAEIGAGVNIGAGTITCNYDGVHKHKTILEDGVFVGSDVQFVAPVRVGQGAIVGAGTTVTQDVPPDALAVNRTPQKNIAGYASTRWKRLGKKEE